MVYEPVPRDVVANHEAGHAVVGYRLGYPVNGIWVRSNTGMDTPRGVWTWVGETKVGDDDDDAPEGSHDHCRICLGGPVAEAIYVRLDGISADEQCQDEWNQVVGHLGEEGATTMLASVREQLERPENRALISALANGLLQVTYLPVDAIADLLAESACFPERSPFK